MFFRGFTNPNKPSRTKKVSKILKTFANSNFLRELLTEVNLYVMLLTFWKLSLVCRAPAMSVPLVRDTPAMVLVWLDYSDIFYFCSKNVVGVFESYPELVI